MSKESCKGRHFLNAVDYNDSTSDAPMTAMISYKATRELHLSHDVEKVLCEMHGLEYGDSNPMPDKLRELYTSYIEGDVVITDCYKRINLDFCLDSYSRTDNDEKFLADCANIMTKIRILKQAFIDLEDFYERGIEDMKRSRKELFKIRKEIAEKKINT